MLICADDADSKCRLGPGRFSAAEAVIIVVPGAPQRNGQRGEDGYNVRGIQTAGNSGEPIGRTVTAWFSGINEICWY